MSDAVAALLSYDSSFRALICLNASCRYALQASAVRRHLRKMHRVDAALLQQAIQYVATLSEVCSPAQLPLQPDGSPQHLSLRLYSVFQCRQCRFIAQNRKTLKVHGNQQHALRRATDAERYTSAKAQSWTAGVQARYWIVTPGITAATAASTPSAAMETASAPVDLSELAAQTTARIDAQALERYQLVQVPSADELTPWLRHTGWNTALTMTALTFQQLAALKRQSDVAETDLRRLTALFDRILLRATATMAQTDADLLLWLQSPKNESAAKRPFAALQDAPSLPRYAAYWKSLLCYTLRTAPQDGATTATVSGVVFSNRQQRKITSIRRELASQEINEVDALGHSTCDTDALDALVFELCIRLIRQRLDRNTPFESPLMHWLGCYGH